MRRRYLPSLLALACLFSISGATCVRRSPIASTNQAPLAFAGQPSIEQIIAAVNGNTQRVQQLQTTAAKLNVAGVSPLSADLALDRPRRFRLQAKTAFTGAELDLGSNDEQFWIWVRRAETPTVYFARHAEFANAASRTAFAVSPEWFIEAMGLVQFDPHVRHEGPYRRQPGTWEIRSYHAHAGGGQTKVTVVDDLYGWVLQQHVRDARGQLLASAVASRHEYDPVQQVSLPRTVAISLPSADLSFTIQVNDYVVNQAFPPESALWTMPRVDGADYKNLAEPTGNVLEPTIPASYRSARNPQVGPDRTRPWLKNHYGFSSPRQIPSDVR